MLWFSVFFLFFVSSSLAVTSRQVYPTCAGLDCMTFVEIVQAKWLLVHRTLFTANCSTRVNVSEGALFVSGVIMTPGSSNRV